MLVVVFPSGGQSSAFDTAIQDTGLGKETHMRTRIILSVLAVIALLALVAACGDDDDDDGGDDGGDDTGAETVDIELLEFSVVPSADSAASGDVTFDIENTGPNDPHEFVVIKTDLDAADLPTKDDGSVDEDGEGIEVVDEVEEIAVGSMESLTVNLDPGNYALICNLVEEEDGELESHYQEGMHVGFTVE
jgi:hypothetical protein